MLRSLLIFLFNILPKKRHDSFVTRLKVRGTAWSWSTYQYRTVRYGIVQHSPITHGNALFSAVLYRVSYVPVTVHVPVIAHFTVQYSTVQYCFRSYSYRVMKKFTHLSDNHNHNNNNKNTTRQTSSHRGNPYKITAKNSQEDTVEWYVVIDSGMKNGLLFGFSGSRVRLGGQNRDLSPV